MPGKGLACAGPSLRFEMSGYPRYSMSLFGARAVASPCGFEGSKWAAHGVSFFFKMIQYFEFNVLEMYDHVRVMQLKLNHA